ncbi:MAG: hypothetical protein COA33_000260 [Fluviicola sp.]|nr:hypothetical protein [Fluviicola sp.]
MKTSILTKINLSIVVYFVFVFLIYTYKIEHVLIGVIWEITLLPMMLAPFVFLGFSIYSILKKEKDVWFLISAALLFICVIILIGSLF